MHLRFGQPGRAPSTKKSIEKTIFRSFFRRIRKDYFKTSYKKHCPAADDNKKIVMQVLY